MNYANRSPVKKTKLLRNALGLAIAMTLGLPAAKAADVTWDLTIPGVWDTSTGNWTGGVPTANLYANGDTAIFNKDDGGIITLTGTVAPLATNVSAASGTYTFTGAGITAGTLTKSGAGTLVLQNANTYTGGTTISEGTLRVNAQSYPKNANNRTSLGAMSVASDATLELINTGAAGAYGAPGIIVLRDLTLSGAGTVVTGGTGVTDFWDGDNLVNLTGFTGTFHATGGTMAFQINQPRTSGVNAMILDSGTHLDLRTNGGLTLSSLTGTGTVGSSWTANQVLTVGALNATSQFDGVIQNTVPGFSNAPTIALTKIGGGTLTLTGANTYTGRTTVNGGTLEINGGILASTSALTLGGGTLSLTGSGTTQTLNGLTTTANTGSRILLAADKTLTLGALTSADANSAVNFNTAAGGADASTSALGTSKVVLTGQTAGNVINKGFTVTDSTGFGLATVDASNNVIRGTTTALLLASGATSPNDYQIDNNAGGAAAAGSSSLAITASQSAGSITVDTTAGNGALNLNSGAVLSSNTWNFGGVGSNTYQITGGAGGASLRSVASNDTITFNNYNTGIVTIASPILANGTNAVHFNGPGTTVLSGANTYTGGTTISTGTLVQDLSSRSGTINNIGAFTVNAGAVYELKSGANTGADTTLFQNNSLSGTGTVRKTGAGYIGMAHTGSNTSNFNGTYDIQEGILGFNSGIQGSGLATMNITGSSAKLDVRTGTVRIDALNGVVGSQVYVSHTTNSTLSLGNNNGSGTFNGTIDNGGASRTLALIKNGTGTQTLAGANSYTGGLTVNGGILNYTGAVSVTGSGGNVLIGSGATLNLSGTANNQLEATGVITVAGTLAATNAGVATTLRGTSIILNGGTIATTVANTSNWGAFLVNSAVTINANGTGNTISGTSVIGISSGNILTLNTALGGDTLAVTGTLGQGSSGTAGGVTKTGLGTVTFTGANTYTGPTTINAGTLIVTGSLANNGPAHIFMAAPDNDITGNPVLTRAIAAGTNMYAGYGSTVSVASLDTVLTPDAPLQTRAEILMSGVTSSGDLSMQWRLRDSAEASPSNPNAVLSDVLNLTTGTGTEVFVLSMSYNDLAIADLDLDEVSIATSGELRLGWNDGGVWTTATDGNSAGPAGSSFAGVLSWSDFVSANGNFDASDLGNYLGKYGVDPGTKTVWAVLDHNSEFAVIPEPSTLVAGSVMALGLALAGRRRRLSRHS